MMRSALILLLSTCCLSCCGCATVTDALIDGVVDSIFDSDDDCEIDPYVLKRKGIEPGSKEHRKLEGSLRLQKEHQREVRAEAREHQLEEQKRYEELKTYREFNERLNASLNSGS